MKFLGIFVNRVKHLFLSFDRWREKHFFKFLFFLFEMPIDCVLLLIFIDLGSRPLNFSHLLSHPYIITFFLASFQRNFFDSVKCQANVYGHSSWQSSFHSVLFYWFVHKCKGFLNKITLERGYMICDRVDRIKNMVQVRGIVFFFVIDNK